MAMFGGVIRVYLVLKFVLSVVWGQSELCRLAIVNSKVIEGNSGQPLTPDTSCLIACDLGHYHNSEILTRP